MEEASTLVISSWAWLPSHLLDLILEKLIPISDHIRFSAVCKHWKSVAFDHKQQLLKSGHKQLPMLMVSSKHNSKRRGLYSVTLGKTCSFELNVPSNKNFCGSSYGWLACEDDNSVITLLNPFTGRTISLPPITEVPPEFLGDYYITKVVLSADPWVFPNDYEALVIYHRAGKKIAHLKSGDDGWTHIVIATIIGFSDVIYYRGQFLVVSYDGFVFSINVSSGSVYKDMVVELAPPGGAYLVESSNGDLLLVRKAELYDFPSRRVTTSFQVYKVQCAGGNRPGWVEEIESIGNDALFLCNVESMCVSASDFPGCHPNSIYFSHSYWAGHPACDEAQVPLDMSAFNLETGRTEMHYYCFHRSQKNLPPSIWILPTMV